MQKFSASSILFARVIIALAIIFWMIPPGSSLAQTVPQQESAGDTFVNAIGKTSRVSVSSSGVQGNYYSASPSINEDGRWVAFSSGSTNLVDDDTNEKEDIFLHNQVTGITTIVSTSSDGVIGNGLSWYPSITADGSMISFSSFASNLVSNDTNSHWDVFIKEPETGETTIASISTDGERGNGDSWISSISADGRFVAFESYASNLVTEDTNTVEDIFLHDQQTGATIRVSVSTTGEQGNKSSNQPSISANGQFVAFHSDASNLVLGDTNTKFDVFLHDRNTGETTRISVSSSGEEGNSDSFHPSVSADGRYVAFYSRASNLVNNDLNGYADVFVHDCQTGETTLISVSSTGAAGNKDSLLPSISADGRFVSFESAATNLVSGHSYGYDDIFVHDQLTGATTLVSVSSAGAQANSWSGPSSISSNGNYVAFESEAFNLVTGDTNNYSDIFVNLRESYSISGTILSEDLTAESGVTIFLIDSSDLFFSGVINDFDGNYSLTGIPSGTYLLIPWKYGYSFTPEYLYVTVPGDATDQNFTAAPISHSPSENEKLTASKVTFAWEAFPDAVSYKLQVSTNIGFSTLLLNIKVSEPTYFFDTYLPYNTTYYWKVRPIYADGKDPWLPAWQFVSMDPLAKPVLTEPAPKESIYSSEVTFRWDPVDYATEYKILIAKDALFAVKYDKVKTADLYATFNNLPPGKYFWRVRAFDEYSAKGPWSDYRIFKIVVP
jgi:hypothetical protein